VAGEGSGLGWFSLKSMIPARKPVLGRLFSALLVRNCHVGHVMAHGDVTATGVCDSKRGVKLISISR
jgi:hypothetical protein